MNISLKYVGNFEIEFLDNKRRLDLTQKEVAHKLYMTNTTLNAKIRNPDKLNIKDLKNLEALGFKFHNPAYKIK